MENRKYEDLDKAITAEIMEPFRGKVIGTVCDCCHNDDLYKADCENCNGVGHYPVQY